VHGTSPVLLSSRHLSVSRALHIQHARSAFGVGESTGVLLKRTRDRMLPPPGGWARLLPCPSVLAPSACLPLSMFSTNRSAVLCLCSKIQSYLRALSYGPPVNRGIGRCGCLLIHLKRAGFVIVASCILITCSAFGQCVRCVAATRRSHSPPEDNT
jgi:hypothetical protein